MGAGLIDDSLNFVGENLTVLACLDVATKYQQGSDQKKDDCHGNLRKLGNERYFDYWLWNGYCQSLGRVLYVLEFRYAI